jgi:hypothetical protein
LQLYKQSFCKKNNNEAIPEQHQIHRATFVLSHRSFSYYYFESLVSKICISTLWERFIFPHYKLLSVLYWELEKFSVSYHRTGFCSVGDFRVWEINSSGLANSSGKLALRL